MCWGVGGESNREIVSYRACVHGGMGGGTS